MTPNVSTHLSPVREGPLHLPVDVLLKLLHVEQLEGLLELQRAVVQPDDVVADGALLVQDVAHEDGGAREALHQDVALKMDSLSSSSPNDDWRAVHSHLLVHLDLAALSDLPLGLGHSRVPHGVLETVHADPKRKNLRKIKVRFQVKIDEPINMINSIL